MKNDYEELARDTLRVLCQYRAELGLQHHAILALHETMSTILTLLLQAPPYGPAELAGMREELERQKDAVQALLDSHLPRPELI